MARFSVSISTLVSFSAKTGSFDRRFEPSPTAQEGIAGHHQLQRKRGNQYLAEYPVSWEEDFDNIRLTVRGRCDGVVMLERLAEEIKTTKISPEHIPQNTQQLHWAQLKAYGYLVALQHHWETVNLRLTYLRIDDGHEHSDTQAFSIKDLEREFINHCQTYALWLKNVREWQIQRDHSIRELNWPFPTYRDGQRTMAVGVYKAIQEQQDLLIEAPTGIGKSLASLFPAIKALPDTPLDSIWFLSAKNSGHAACQQGLQKLHDQGLAIKSLELTAKEKACLNEIVNCQADTCPYADGFFDKLPAARKALYNEQHWSRETMKNLAQTHQICPYYLAQEMVDWSDVIYGDYNYGFDPTARHSVYFSDHADRYVMLVDEAHNLADRTRAMLGASIDRDQFASLMPHASPDIDKLLDRAQKAILRFAQKYPRSSPYVAVTDKPESLARPLQQFLRGIDDFLVEMPQLLNQDDALRGVYFDTLRFTRILELFDQRYVTEIRTHEYQRRKQASLGLRCLDPSQHLKTCYLTGRAHLLFSATLRPLTFQAEETGIATEQIRSLPSPFPPDHLAISIVTDVSTKYEHRDHSLPDLARLIDTVAASKTGNYLVFMPSFRYAQSLEQCWKTTPPDFDWVSQTPNMAQDQREAFLQRFESAPSRTSLVGLAVAGGIFGEGIDLTGDQLIGVIVVGPALPQFGPEQDTLKDYHQNRGRDGFAYAYQFPGLQRVMQAAGRVIRTENDKGVVVLVDPRFTEQRYRQHYPPHWHPTTLTTEALPDNLARFWRL